MGSTCQQCGAVVCGGAERQKPVAVVRSCFPREAVALLLPVEFARFKMSASVSNAVRGEERLAPR